MQLLPAGRDIPFVHVPPLTTEKGAAEVDIELSVRAPGPVLLTVIVCVSEPPTATTPKSTEEADTLIVPHTLTVAEQVAVVPAQFCAVKVQVCVEVGEVLAEPLAPESVPLPRLPVQL